MSEFHAQFEQRKKDHIRIALDPKVQALGHSGLDLIRLEADSLPNLNFSEISLKTKIFSHELSSPIFISSMTAGCAESAEINLRLAKLAQEKNWAMGVGSQRKELFDPQAGNEWKLIRKQFPSVVLFGNIGLAQLIEATTSDVQQLVENLQASALFVHVNALQEVLQYEGTPNFKDGLFALERVCKHISVPVIVKEVGCGFSAKSLQALKNTGIYAVDVAGYGGTHWGRIEGERAHFSDLHFQAAKTFSNWGTSTLESMLNAEKANINYKLWASGGVRTGLDIAKLIALGAEMVGVAKPMLEAALVSEESLRKKMELLEFELRTALFCSGFQDCKALNKAKAWLWNF